MIHTLETLNAAELAPVARDVDEEDEPMITGTPKSTRHAPTASHRTPSVSARTTARSTTKGTARSGRSDRSAEKFR